MPVSIFSQQHHKHKRRRLRWALASVLIGGIVSSPGAHAEGGAVTVHSVLRAAELLDRSASAADSNIALGDRALFVMLGPSKVPPAVLKDEPGRWFMVAREAGFRVVRPQAAPRGPAVHLLIDGLQPCRLQVVQQVVLVDATGTPSVPQEALRARGCEMPSNRYGGMALIGAFDEAFIVKKAPVPKPVPPLELQQIPEGVSPDSPLAKEVIPWMNRQRAQEHQAAGQVARAEALAAQAEARGHGLMLDSDARIRPLLDAAAGHERLRGLEPALFVRAGESRVYFVGEKGAAAWVSFDKNRRVRVETP